MTSREAEAARPVATRVRGVVTYARWSTSEEWSLVLRVRVTDKAALQALMTGDPSDLVARLCAVGSAADVAAVSSDE